MKKETAVLTDDSLLALATALGDRTLMLVMYLNVPTTALIHLQVSGREAGQSPVQTAHGMLLHWRQLRALARERDKIADMDRALREMGRPEMATVFGERHQEGLELDEKCFANIQEAQT